MKLNKINWWYVSYAVCWLLVLGMCWNSEVKRSNYDLSLERRIERLENKCGVGK